MDVGVVLQTNPPAAARGRARPTGRAARLQPRVDVRLAPALGGAVRHLQPDPRRDAQGGRRARWSPTRRPGTGRSPRRCSPRSTRCTATARSAASVGATPPCGSRTARRPPWPRCARPSTSSASSATGARSSTRARPCGFPWGQRQRRSTCGSPPTGPRRSRSPVRSATASSSSSPTPTSRRGRSRRCARRRRRPGAIPTPITICVAAPAYVSDDLAHARDQCRWFGGMVGQPRRRPGRPLRRRRRRHRARRAHRPTSRVGTGYDYNEHGRAGNTHTDFVPDDVIDRFCILGPVEAHVARLRELAGARRRPVRRLPPARRQGVDARGLRRARHPGRARAGHRQAIAVTARQVLRTTMTVASAAP